MKFALPATAFAALLGVTDAAWIKILGSTGPGLIPTGSTTLYGNDGRHNSMGFLMDGCKRGGYPWLGEICIDSKNNRAHVWYTSGLKRCFRRTHTWSELCGGGAGCWNGVCVRCWEWHYTEARCDW